MSVSELEKLQQAFERCTWGNSSETASDWLATLKGKDEGARKRLFSRLFLESPDSMVIRDIFSEIQIKTYLAVFNKQLTRSHLEKRRKVWRFLYLHEREPIPELDWVIET